ncbi:MAG: hypothetical protein IPM60_08480 [Rhodospirillales bacterium]|nr:hypothetical protein [Rhodospirillales bacterium]
MNLRFFMLAAAALALLGGCAGGPGSAEPNLGAACQLKPCACEKIDTPFWKRAETVPLEWQADGSATCPAGYVLRRTDAEK